ncbi:hypothetical protein MYX75_03130 [Acidobacteria bacterium AH-259-A15]|nr:hypothetical protein [Acidobacteria bacterium AH-259-A15]
MTAILADTGPLYALVDPDDQYHSQAQAEAQRISDEDLTVGVSYPILLEAYTLVLQRLGIRVARVWRSCAAALS